MGIGSFLRRVNRAIERFNRWLAPAALAENAGVARHIDAERTAAIVGELDRQSEGARDDSEPK